MTVVAYNRIKAALKAQRDRITHSPEAAAQLITDLGIRDILIDKNISKKPVRKKTLA